MQNELAVTKRKLDKLISDPIWSQVVEDELDETIDIFQGLHKAIIDLIDIQRSIMPKI